MRDDSTVALNRKARHEYTIDETFEAGLVLTGTEIKSIRAGKANIANAYARIERDEAWLVGADIAPFESGNRYNHDPKRTRKLLLHRRQIDELLGRAKAKGQTIVPLRLYITRGKAKIELGPGPRQAAPRQAPRHRRPRLEARHRARDGRRPARPPLGPTPPPDRLGAPSGGRRSPTNTRSRPGPARPSAQRYRRLSGTSVTGSTARTRPSSVTVPSRTSTSIAAVARLRCRDSRVSPRVPRTAVSVRPCRRELRGTRHPGRHERRRQRGGRPARAAPVRPVARRFGALDRGIALAERRPRRRRPT